MVYSYLYKKLNPGAGSQFPKHKDILASKSFLHVSFEYRRIFKGIPKVPSKISKQLKIISKNSSILYSVKTVSGDLRKLKLQITKVSLLFNPGST